MELLTTRPAIELVAFSLLALRHGVRSRGGGSIVYDQSNSPQTNRFTCLPHNNRVSKYQNRPSLATV